MLAGMIFGLVVEVVAGAVAVGWLTVQGAPIPIGSEVWTGLALVPVSTGLAAGFGVGVSAIVPNQLGAVLVAVGWVMVVEQLLGGLAPEIANGCRLPGLVSRSAAKTLSWRPARVSLSFPSTFRWWSRRVSSLQRDAA